MDEFEELKLKLVNFLKTMNIDKSHIDPETLSGDFEKDYLQDILDFEGSSADLSKVFEKYGTIIFDRIIHTAHLKDLVMVDENQFVRHDMDIEQAIQQNTYYEDRCKTLIKLEIVKLINQYSMERLMEDFDTIKTEIELGVYDIKSKPYVSKEEKEQADNRVKLAKIFGVDAIQYIENRNLLKERILTLFNYTSNIEEKEKLNKLLNKLESVENLLKAQDPTMTAMLKECFSDYDSINKQMLIARMQCSQEDITKPSDEIMMLHFIPNMFETNEGNISHDSRQKDFFNGIVQESIREIIAKKYNRPYDPKKDAEEEKELLNQWEEARNNPANFDKRVPIKNLYMKSFHLVITGIYTKLSCSIANPGFLKPHLDRKIAIGFVNISHDAIETISSGYNNSVDEFSFKNHSVPFPEALETAKWSVENKSRITNELLIDWTKVKPAYILVIKDKKEIDKNIMEEAERLSVSANLPIRIYDQYTIDRNKTNPTDDLNM